MDLRRYHMISEIFLNNHRTEWRHQSRWYINIKFVQKIFWKKNIRKHFGTVLTEEIWIAKFCAEVFVMPKHLMTKVGILGSFLFMSPLFATLLNMRRCIVWWMLKMYIYTPQKSFASLTFFLYFKLSTPVKSRKMIWPSSNFQRMFLEPITVDSVKKKIVLKNELIFVHFFFQKRVYSTGGAKLLLRSSFRVSVFLDYC